jgi:glycosyltransferase involved in cell wall biosynthesis
VNFIFQETDCLMSEKPINVMMIIGGLGDGGKERQLLLLLKALKQNKDVSTFLFVLNSGGERETEARQVADNIFVLPGKRGINLIKPVLEMVKLIKQNNINLIHTWGSGLWDLMGLVAGRLSSIPVIHNGIRSAPARLNFYNWLTRIGAFFADVAVANSYAGLRAFKLLNHPKYRVIHNGLDLSRFEGVQIIEEGQNLCMVANFHQGKDHKTLILAMPEILNHFPNTKLFLIGHDYGNLTSIQKIANDLQITKNVIFVTNCTQPEPIISKCQIGILATYSEGISNALLEYMALSKPVVASKNYGNMEVIVENVTGFLVAPRNPDLISEKVNYLLQNPDIAKKMGRQGKDVVQERFSLSKMEKEYLDLYQEVAVNEKV